MSGDSTLTLYYVVRNGNELWRCDGPSPCFVRYLRIVGRWHGLGKEGRGE